MKYTKHLDNVKWTEFLEDKKTEKLPVLPSLFSHLLGRIGIQNVFVSLLNTRSIACMQKMDQQERLDVQPPVRKGNPGGLLATDPGGMVVAINLGGIVVATNLGGMVVATQPQSSG